MCFVCAPARAGAANCAPHTPATMPSRVFRIPRRSTPVSSLETPSAIWTAETLRRRRQKVVLLVHVTRDADDEEFERRGAGVGEGLGFSDAHRDGVAALDRRGLVADRGRAFAVHHVLEAAV